MNSISTIQLKKKNNGTIYISAPTISWTEKSFWGNYEPINYDIEFIKKKKKNYDIEEENENATGMFHDFVDHVRKY